MNPYEILGVDKGATEKDIKKAYRNLCKEHHPDKGGDSDKFKEISSAYEILSDPQKKQQYDTFGDAKSNPFGGSPFNGNPFSGFGGFGVEDMIRDMFSGGDPFSKQRTRKGGDESVTVTMTLAEIMTGASKKITYSRDVVCDSCVGKGGAESTTCTTCNGTGEVYSAHNTQMGIFRRSVRCTNCTNGYIITNPCNKCHGSGVFRKIENTSVTIPPGVANEMHMSMSEGGNYIKNGAPGNLLIRIQEIPHAEIKRVENNHLTTDLWISLSEAVLGSEKIVNTPVSSLKFEIESGCESGKVYSFNGKGVPNLGNDGKVYGSGNFYVKVNVRIPKPTEETKHIFEELKKNNM